MSLCPFYVKCYFPAFQCFLILEIASLRPLPPTLLGYIQWCFRVAPGSALRLQVTCAQKSTCHSADLRFARADASKSPFARKASKNKCALFRYHLKPILIGHIAIYTMTTCLKAVIPNKFLLWFLESYPVLSGFAQWPLPSEITHWQAQHMPRIGPRWDTCSMHKPLTENSMCIPNSET